ncbi:MAG: hypothetical protein J6Y28_07135 [Acholeplasmatales bacterium]|nr:hypothetical protein [Acholeplasmatales bacterium]
MASLNDKNTKSIMELNEDYLLKLDNLIEENINYTSKTRDNLLNCIESNKKSNQNSTKRCQKTLQEIDNEIKLISPHYALENEKIQEKNEARIANNNKTIEEYLVEYKSSLVDINKQYDQVVNEENDRLDNLQYLNRKELQQYIQGIDIEEFAQHKELDNAISMLNFEIHNLQTKLVADVERLRQDYLMKASGYNEDMRRTRNEFIEKEKELRNISREETSSHHKQIEELTKAITVKQKTILNNFSNDLLKLSSEGDQILLDNADDQLKLLSLQAQNKQDKRILEIEKDHNLKLEKEKEDTKIRNLKILKLDLDNQNTTRINKENVYSLMRINEFEKDSLLSDAIKENKIRGLSLDANAKINNLHEKLNDKKNDLDFFTKRFSLLRTSKNKIIELYSHLYDITTTLVLDLNQLERESVLEHEKVLLKKKQENVDYLNKVSQYECDKEISNNTLKAQLETIELEIKKINTSFDDSVFKTRSSYNTEKTRIEHIYQMFESKYNTEVKTLENDINYIIDVLSKLKEEIFRTSSKTIDDLKKEKESEEKIKAFAKMMHAEFSFVREKVEEYYSDKELRLTQDVDEVINDYIKSSINKRRQFENEFKELNKKTGQIENEIKEIENDIYILEANRRNHNERNRRDYDDNLELKEIDEQIDEKTFRLHILKLRLKSQTKDLLNLETEISKIDEGKELLSKKENKKLYELEFENKYYNEYDELQEMIDNIFKALTNDIEECMEKAEIKSIYIFSAASLKELNKAISAVKKYHYQLLDEYKNEFRKITRACQNGLEKEKKTFEINLDLINRERDITIDDEQSKIAIAKKNARDAETKANVEIINLKIKSDEILKSFDDDLNEYDRQYGLKVAALESNASSMKKFYDEAIANENKQRNINLQQLYKKHNQDKIDYENNIARLESNYAIEMEKLNTQARNRLTNVIKQYNTKAIDFDNQLKLLDEALKKSSNECNTSIIDSNTQLTDFIKKLDNNKLNDIKKTKDEISRKLKHDIKKYKAGLENKNNAQ